jgi:hypothetical protein
MIKLNLNGINELDLDLAGSITITPAGNGVINISQTIPVATTSSVGLVKPDGTTVTIDPDGTIHSTGGGGSVVATFSDESGSRAYGTIYQNTTGKPILVSGGGQTSPGGSVGSLTALVGSTTPVFTIYATEATATVSGAYVGFCFIVPDTWYYMINVSGAFPGPNFWTETTLG